MNADERGSDQAASSSSSAQSASSADGPSSPPIPPRYWWLKRLLVASACLLVALILLRVWWGHHVQALLDAEIAGYRAGGQLVYAKEFDELLDAIPDEDNAALIYEEALTVQSNVLTTVTIDYEMMEGRHIARDPDPVRDLIDANATVFDLIRQARGRDQVNWSPNPTGRPLCLLAPVRPVGVLLAIRAAWQMHTGDHADAIETFEDALSYGEAIEAEPYNTSGMIGQICLRMMFSVIGEHCVALRVEGTTDAGSFEDRPATRESVERLIAHLLDESRSRHSYIRMWYMERAFALQMPEPGTGAGSPAGPGAVFSIAVNKLRQPMMRLNLLRTLRWYTSMIEHAAKGTYPDATRGLARDAAKSSFVTSLTEGLTAILAPSSEGTLARFYNYLAYRRMAAIALAIRLYELDHDERPADLALLVPDYLPAVPVDPFSPESGPIRYVRDLDPPILYSVWKDGEDDGGYQLAPGVPGWEGTDRTVYLGPKPDDDE